MSDIRPGDEVLIIAKVIEVVDASQTLDLVVEFGNDPVNRATITDSDLARQQGKVLVKRSEG